MSHLSPASIDPLPDFCGNEDVVAQTMACLPVRSTLPEHQSPVADAVASAFAIALHMHQPLIPAGTAGGGDGPVPRAAKVVGNLRHMLEHPELPDAHNASVFLDCYRRMGRFIPELVHEGGRPRVMLDYSGCLLHGLHEMGAHDVIGALIPLAQEPRLIPCVEWLGTAWGHAVAPSTPVQDFRLHVRAWQHHFAAIFGLEALSRVRGFSPPEMALPNHPDVAYEFVRTLKECGYRWVLVQEHTVEEADNGGPIRQPHLPHRLLARNSRGEEICILALVKTQGSDTKLVGQMQPYYEARGLARVELGSRRVPPLVTQISDGENGGVMMNEFPPMFLQVMRQSAGLGAASGTIPMNGSEYLDCVLSAGVREEDLPAARPLFHNRLFRRVTGDTDRGPRELEHAIEQARREDPRFHMEGGSWTANLSWVRGYESVLGPMEAASAVFSQRFLGAGVPATDPRYRTALFHLLCAQTSCFRYWGQGTWSEYGKELCRRVMES